MIPLIFGAIALGSAAIGAISGISGVADMSDARDIVEAAKESYQQVYGIYEETRASTELGFKNFTDFKIEIQTSIVTYYAELNQKNGNCNSDDYPQFTEQLGSTISQQMHQYQSGQISAEEFFHTMGSVFDAIDAIGEIVNADNHKGLLAIGATKLATTVGVASTGTAISGLSGAAANSAALAWLGGGSLAAGGGGMALGSAILTGLTAGPALAFLGFTIAGKGARDLEQAIEYHHQIEEKNSELVSHIEQLEQIQQRISERWDLIYSKYEFLYEEMEKLEDCLDRGNPNQATQSRDLQKIQKLAREIFALINQPVAV